MGFTVSKLSINTVTVFYFIDYGQYSYLIESLIYIRVYSWISFQAVLVIIDIDFKHGRWKKNNEVIEIWEQIWVH